MNILTIRPNKGNNYNFSSIRDSYSTNDILLEIFVVMFLFIFTLTFLSVLAKPRNSMKK